MLLFRFAIFFLLLAAGVCFAFYVGTSDVRYRRWGLVILKWTLIAALGFFGVLILERVLCTGNDRFAVVTCTTWFCSSGVRPRLLISS
jgi:hypothetical protein